MWYTNGPLQNIALLSPFKLTVGWEETRSVFLEELLAIDPIQNNLFYVVGETVLLENFQSF